MNEELMNDLAIPVWEKAVDKMNDEIEFINESLEFDVLSVEEKLNIAEQLLSFLEAFGGDKDENTQN